MNPLVLAIIRNSYNSALYEFRVTPHFPGLYEFRETPAGEGDDAGGPMIPAAAVVTAARFGGTTAATTGRTGTAGMIAAPEEPARPVCGAGPVPLPAEREAVTQHMKDGT